jgi:prophage DNA circulation protein
MTVDTRLDALEKGQVDILAKLGSIEGQVGTLDGTLNTWMGSADNLANKMEQLCEIKHERVDARLGKLEEWVKGTSEESHERRIVLLEKWATGRVASWSTAKTAAVGFCAFVALVGTTTGIIAAIFHIIIMVR